MVDREVKRGLSYLPPASILTFQSLLSGTLEPAGLFLGPFAGESESHRKLVSSGAERSHIPLSLHSLSPRSALLSESSLSHCAHCPVDNFFIYPPTSPFFLSSFFYVHSPTCTRNCIKTWAPISLLAVWAVHPLSPFLQHER